MVKRFLTQLQWLINDGRQSFTCQVITCWTKSPGTDNHIRSVGCRSKDVHIVRQRVADRAVKDDFDTKFLQSAAQPLTVCVQPCPAGHLVSNGNDFGRQMRGFNLLLLRQLFALFCHLLSNPISFSISGL